MICPYCDSLLKETPESGTCPNCGGPIGAPVRKMREQAKKQRTLEYYYQRYQPDKIQAIVALRVDTGLDAVTAKQKIDKVFAAHASEKQNVSYSEEKRTMGTIHCPKCLSTEIVIEQSVSKLDKQNWPYSTRVIDQSKYRCRHCGYEWQTR